MAVQGSDYFIIERGGAVYHVLASDILAYVQSLIGTSEYDVPNIAARNALTNLSIGDRVYVVDATGDSTVNSGWAIYTYRGSNSWTKVAEQEGLDVQVGGTDLTYVATPTGGQINSSTGADATLPAANATNAGLMVPAQFTKLGYIAVGSAVDLNNLATASHAAATLAGNTNTNPLTLSGQVLGFSISQLTAAP